MDKDENIYANPDDVFNEGRFKFKDGMKYLINDGSVGQPRDGDNRAAFCLVDTSEGWADIVRVEYDIGRAAEAIENAGLPSILGTRLYQGR